MLKKLNFNFFSNIIMKKMKVGKGLNIVWVLVILAILVIIMLFTMKEGFKEQISAIIQPDAQQKKKK